MPFGKMHSLNPEIIHYAKLIGRTPSALAMKLTNIASLDPAITSTGRKGLEGASAADKAMWEEMQADWEPFVAEAQRTLDALGAATEFDADLDDTSGIDDVVVYSGSSRDWQGLQGLGSSLAI